MLIYTLGVWCCLGYIGCQVAFFTCSKGYEATWSIASAGYLIAAAICFK